MASGESFAGGQKDEKGEDVPTPTLQIEFTNLEDDTDDDDAGPAAGGGGAWAGGLSFESMARQAGLLLLGSAAEGKEDGGAPDMGTLRVPSPNVLPPCAASPAKRALDDDGSTAPHECVKTRKLEPQVTVNASVWVRFAASFICTCGCY